MGRVAAVVAAAAIVVGAVGAKPIPVHTRAEAVDNLKAAIEDERRALELLKKDPPHLRAARYRIYRSADLVSGIYDFLSGVPNAAAGQDALGGARADDFSAAHVLNTHYGPRPAGLPRAIELLERALLRKRAALPFVQDAQPPPAVAQCSDGKDNDRDGITDWTAEPGCSSARDVRESSPFTCGLDSKIVTGRIVVQGSCSGAFSEVEFMLLDDVQLNGRWDVMRAPSCSQAPPTRVRCTTKSGPQNPGRLIDARFATTSKNPLQRVQLRFFDIRMRQIGRFVVPPVVVPQGAPKVAGPFRISVAVPQPGDINLTVVTLRGSSPQTMLENLPRLAPSVMAVAATRRLAQGTSQLWLGVLNRGLGGSSGTGAGDGTARFAVRGATRTGANVFSSLTMWPAAPPPICTGGNPAARRPITGLFGWEAAGDRALKAAVARAIDRITVDMLCDVPVDPPRAAEFGVPASDFELRLNSPTEVGVTGTIPVASRGFVLTPVPNGIVGVGGKDGRGCLVDSRGTERFVFCGGNRTPGQPIDLTMTFSQPPNVTPRTIRSTFFDPAGRQFGPFWVRGP